MNCRSPNHTPGSWYNSPFRIKRPHHRVGAGSGHETSL